MARQVSEGGGDSAYEPAWRPRTSQEQKRPVVVQQMWSGEFQREDTGSVKGGSPRSEVPSLDPQRFRALYNFDEDDSEMSSTQESTNFAGAVGTMMAGASEDTKMEQEVELQLGKEAVKSESSGIGEDSQPDFVSLTKGTDESEGAEKVSEILMQELEIQEQSENSQYVEEEGVCSEQNQMSYLPAAESSSGIDTSSEEDNAAQASLGEKSEGGFQNVEGDQVSGKSIVEREDVVWQLPASTLVNANQEQVALPENEEEEKEEEATKVTVAFFETSSSSSDDVNRVRVDLRV
eukprot:TRINITY_DN20574_c1_g1_i2.p1 TRINITY_DN20574_c1_g1~~TRINITY_DN20574_c1_g1_i2.p1  ORF type:complete len:292 (-),score=93.99 TRINITY_DN20574_c1_g1_i2:313-1188(-)